MDKQMKTNTFNTLIKRAQNKYKGIRWSIDDEIDIICDRFESVGDIPDTNKYDSFNHTLSTGEVLVLYHHLSSGHVDLTEDSNPTQVMLELSDYLKNEFGIISCSFTPVKTHDEYFFAIDKFRTLDDMEKEVM